jgi:GT2 family glycosyltransferase
MTHPPFVSVIIPARDEERHITACLHSLLRGGYPPERLEVLVVDGRSTDGTRAAVARVARRTSVPIVLIDNPRGLIPTALNLGITHARGEVLIRADAHTLYPPGYLRRCVRVLQASGAGNVGGPIETRPGADTPAARAIALVLSHPFGVGNSAFRTSARPREADTVPFGCFPAAIFHEIGLFDERLHRNEDYSFNQRLRRAGRRIVLDPRLRSTYVSRATLRAFLRQAWHNGVWNALSHYLDPGSMSVRHVAPLVFLTGVAAALAGGIAAVQPLPGWMWAAAGTAWGAVGTYLLLHLAVTLRLAARHGWRLWPHLWVAFPALHLTYGAGIAWGWLRVLTRRFPWQPDDGIPSLDARRVEREAA